jgi:2-polyprenyl-3-methyl-5-hydroxy-6-metoxy-1,4-benzoquinol methylase
MSEQQTSPAEFRYPTGSGVLRSVDEFRQMFLPAYYDEQSLGARTFRTLEMLSAAEPDQPRRMLDYGCGAGPFSHHVGRRRPSWTVEGWEGDPSAVTVAQECFARDNVSFQRHDYDAYGDLEEGAYDIVTFLEVIEHVDNPGEILRSFHRALRPGGLLIVSTPNFLGREALYYELWRMARELTRRRTRADSVRALTNREYDATTNEGHVALYSIDTLVNVIQLNGFELETFDIAPRSYGRRRDRLWRDTLIVLARKPL